MADLKKLRLELRALGDPAIAAHSSRYFKTGPGQYGEGDRFRGIRIPELRRLSRKHNGIDAAVAEKLLQSAWHEDRLTALFILVLIFNREKDDSVRKALYDLYLANTKRINNWDLVDCSAGHIVGGWLYDKSRAPLMRLAKSDSLWERRIAIISTFYFIKQGETAETFRIAEKLLADKDDLIHKAVGWALREAGKCDLAAKESFLNSHGATMPRTMLRCAIEKFPEARRKAYLQSTR